MDQSYIGNGPHTVKVMDLLTGQSCWGTIIVEDKLPPVIVCRDITVPCTQDLSLLTQPAPGITGSQSIIYEGLNDIIEFGANTPRSYDFDFGYLPAGTPALDVDVRVKLTGHTWLPDLDMVVTAPDGTTTADVFTLSGCFGAEFPIDVTWDDEGAGNLTLCVQLNAGGAPLQSVVAPGMSGPTVLSVFDGIDASGTWNLTIRDNFAGDAPVDHFDLCVFQNLA